MQRSFSSSALVLKVKTSGESNREVVFLCAQEGIISATLYGGPKSRLRSHVSPFNSGLLWLYRDPAKDFRKVNDFDVQSWRPGLRELYERSNTASSIAGLVLASYGGGGFAASGSAGHFAAGNFADAYTMVNAVLDTLETADEAFCERLLIHFIWNWTALLGNRSGINHCASCSCEYSGEGLLYFISEEGFFCKNCMARKTPFAGEPQAANGLALGPGACRWLLAVQDKPPAELARYTLDAVSLGELKALTRVL